MPVEEERKLPTFGSSGQDMIYLEHFKLVIVGDRSVGKTCLVVTYGTSKYPDKNPPTVLEAYQGVTNFRGREVVVDIFDTAGHDDF
jgi:small GTP-binding protein